MVKRVFSMLLRALQGFLDSVFKLVNIPLVCPHYTCISRRNLAVGCQKLYGSNKKWKKRYGYYKRSLSETALYRAKQLLGGKLFQRNYNAQVGETYAMIKALNMLTGLGMPETYRID